MTTDRNIRDFLLEQSGLRNLTLTRVIVRLDYIDSECISIGLEDCYEIGGVASLKNGETIEIRYSGKGPRIEKNKANKRAVKKKVETNNWSSTKKIIRQKAKASKKTSKKIR